MIQAGFRPPGLLLACDVNEATGMEITHQSSVQRAPWSGQVVNQTLGSPEV